MDAVRYTADKYQGLFDLMNQEHGLTLTVSEMDEIIHQSLKTAEELKEVTEDYCDKSCPDHNACYKAKKCLFETPLNK